MIEDNIVFYELLLRGDVDGNVVAAHMALRRVIKVDGKVVAEFPQELVPLSTLPDDKHEDALKSVLDEVLKEALSKVQEYSEYKVQTEAKLEEERKRADDAEATAYRLSVDMETIRARDEVKQLARLDIVPEKA